MLIAVMIDDSYIDVVQRVVGHLERLLPATPEPPTALELEAYRAADILYRERHDDV